MTLTIFITLIVVVAAVGLFMFRAIPGIRAFFTYRGERLITCPESHTKEAVEVAAGEAAVGAFLSEPTLHLKECSRWPERQNCGQDCLQQIESNAGDCLVWNIVAKWYAGKRCVLCRKEFGPLHHLDHVPALLGPDYRTTEWKDFSAQDLPKVFDTHQPVCWNCHVTETFRRTRPDLVVDRNFEAKRIR